DASSRSRRSPEPASRAARGGGQPSAESTARVGRGLRQNAYDSEYTRPAVFTSSAVVMRSPVSRSRTGTLLAVPVRMLKPSENVSFLKAPLAPTVHPTRFT